MTRLFPLFLGLLIACSAGPDVQQSDHDIVGGAATPSFPAVGALTMYGGTTCTGTLVGPRKVLTAAHCIDRVAPSSLSFTLGTRIDAPVEVIPVERGVMHPHYRRETLENDVAYLVLSHAPTTAAPMPLVEHIDASFIGRELVFVGFGYDDGLRRRGSGIKRVASIPMTSLGPRSFNYSAPGKNTCQGDSGGPAFAVVNGEYAIAGVTSGGDEHCLEYGYDMRVDVYADFLGVEEDVVEDPPPATCGGETHRGRCDGDTLIWCDGGVVVANDCAADGMPCGYASSVDVYGCMAPVQNNTCQGESFEGRCDGDSVVWCNGQGVERLSCHQGCGYDHEQNVYNCL